MRSSLVLSSSLFKYQIPGLSYVGYFLISTGLRKIEALWYASCGAGAEPLQDVYDVAITREHWRTAPSLKGRLSRQPETGRRNGRGYSYGSFSWRLLLFPTPIGFKQCISVVLDVQVFSLSGCI